MEIERKFILKAFPENLEEETRHTIFQYYLSCDPYVRVRSKLKDGETTYKLTIKGIPLTTLVRILSMRMIFHWKPRSILEIVDSSMKKATDSYRTRKAMADSIPTG